MKKIALLVLYTVFCIIIYPVNVTGKGKCLNRKFYTKLDYEVLATNRVIIKNIHINNSTETFNFLIDSGSSKSSISPRLVNQLNIKTTEKDSIFDGVKKVELFYGEVNYELNGICFSNIESLFEANIMPDTQCDVDGIIGFNLMKLCCWNFNLSDSTIAIANHTSNFDQLDKYYKQYFKEICGTPFVMSNISNNFYSSDMLFDLGDNSKLTIGFSDGTQEYIKKNFPVIQSKGYAVQRAFSATIDTSMSFNIIQFDKFNFGKRNRKKVENSENFISNLAVFVDEEEDFNIIGAGILKEYAIIFDGPKRKFYSRVIGSDPGYSTIGIGILPTDEDYYVATVCDKSSAMEKGVKAGDTILKINNISIRESHSSSCDLYTTVLNEVSKSDSIHITLLRNDEVFDRMLVKKNLFE